MPCNQANVQTPIIVLHYETKGGVPNIALNQLQAHLDSTNAHSIECAWGGHAEYKHPCIVDSSAALFLQLACEGVEAVV